MNFDGPAARDCRGRFVVPIAGLAQLRYSRVPLRWRATMATTIRIEDDLKARVAAAAECAGKRPGVSDLLCKGPLGR